MEHIGLPRMRIPDAKNYGIFDPPILWFTTMFDASPLIFAA
jgi:hypothetical protein